MKVKFRRRLANIMPPSGLRTSDGILFYHLRKHMLKPIHLQRLEECGVKLKMGPFSQEENERIRKNWKKYAAENNVDLNRAYEFAGGYSKVLDRDERKDLLDFQCATNFVPSMCEGFNDRMGQQVITRMMHVFHPSKKCRPKWNDEMEKQLEVLYAEGLPSRAISLRLNRAKLEIDYRISVLRKKKETTGVHDDCDVKLEDNVRQVLYDFVNKWLHPKRCPLELEIMLPEKLSWNIADFAMVQDQEQAMSHLPWFSLVWKTRRSVPEIRKLWLKEVERLREACKKCDGDTERASDLCTPGIPQISVGEYRQALKLILEQKPTCTAGLDTEKLQERIEKENLTGYCTNGLTEAEFLRKMVSIHISNASNYRMASIPNYKEDMKYVDWVKVFIRYLGALDSNDREWYYDIKRLRELVSQRLSKIHRNVSTGEDDATKSANGNDLLTGSVKSDKPDEGKRTTDNVPYTSAEVTESHVCKLSGNEEPIPSGHTEYVIEKLQSLIESRIPLFDEHRQRKYARKLEKIMNREEKLNALQRLVEKMISRLEDEQERKLSKKYRKIMRRYERMQGAEGGESAVQGKLDEAETSTDVAKNANEEGGPTSDANNPETNAGMDDKVKRRGSDVETGAAVVKMSPESQQKAEKENRKWESKRRKRKAEGTEAVNDRSSTLSHTDKIDNLPNKVVGSAQQSKYDTVHGVLSPKKKNMKMEQKVNANCDAISTLLNILSSVRRSSAKPA